MNQNQLNQQRKHRSLLLKAMRTSKGISKSKLSKISGLAKDTIARIESGDKDWNIGSEIIYCDCLKDKS